MIPAIDTPPVVHKFGGASLPDGPSVRRACELVARLGGTRPIVIVSALEGVTGILEELAAGRGETRTLRIRHRTLLSQLELSGELLDPFLRELERLVADLRLHGSREDLERGRRDHLLSFGERMSARIVAAALRSTGLSATPVDAHDLGIVTAAGGPVRLLSSSAARVRDAIAEVPGIPVVTGFLAADERGNLTTLGRNGSDLTALFVAQAVGASEVQLWKSVAGIQTADPRRIPEARTIDELGFDEAIEIARHGARVLHHGAALAARDAGVPVRLRPVLDPESPGTRLVARTPADGPVALVHRDGLLRASIEVERGEELSDLLAGVEDLDTHLLWMELREGAARLVVPDDSAIRGRLEAAGAELESGFASLALVGRGVGTDTDLAARVLDRLREPGIEVLQAELGTREASQAWLIAATDLERALGTLHRWLFTGQPEWDSVRELTVSRPWDDAAERPRVRPGH